MPEDLEQEARISLLQYYSSKCTAHGTNLLTIVIAVFAYVASLRFIPVFLEPITHSLLIPAFVVLLSHQIVRLLVYGHLTQLILEVDPEKVKEKWREEIPDKKNMLHRLASSCWIRFGRESQSKRLWSINSRIINMWVPAIIWVALVFAMFFIQALTGHNSENTPTQNSLLMIDINTLILLLGQTLIGILSAYVSARFLITRREKKERKRAYGKILSEVEQNVALSHNMIKTIKERPEGDLLFLRDDTWNIFRATGYLIDLPEETAGRLLHVYPEIWEVGNLIKHFNDTRDAVKTLPEIEKRIREKILPNLETIKEDLEGLTEE